MSYVQRFEIQSALSFLCWRVRVRQDGTVALLHNVSANPEVVTRLADSGCLLESGEQDGMHLVLTPDRDELIDLQAWSTQPIEATSGEFTRLFVKQALTKPPADSSPEPPAAPPDENKVGEFTSFFLPGKLTSPAPPLDFNTFPESATATIAIPNLQPPREIRVPSAKSDSEPSELNQRWIGRPMIVPPLATPATSPLAPATSPSGEFTRIFQVSDEEQRRPTLAPESAPGSVAPVGKPSEFAASDLAGATRLFSVNEDQPRNLAPEPKGAPDLSDATRIFSADEPPESPRPGEFTRMFQAPLKPVKSPSLAPPPLAEGPPGDFTSFFQPAKQATAHVAPRSPATPASDSEPGGFTSVFQNSQPPLNSVESSAPDLPAQRRTATPPSSESDFDSFFSSPMASNQEVMQARLNDKNAVYSERPMAQEPGQFTRFFGRDEIDAALGGASPPTGAAQNAGPGAAGDSSFPALPMERQAAAPASESGMDTDALASTGPSEFTRVFQRAAPPPPAQAASAPAASPIQSLKDVKSRGSKVWKIVMVVLVVIIAGAAAFFAFIRTHHH